MSADQHLISEREFDESWGAYTAPSGNLFAFDEVRNQPMNHVWTVVETGDDSNGSWYAQPGFHVVNTLGYVLTRKPWTDTTPDAIYFLDDFED